MGGQYSPLCSSFNVFFHSVLMGPLALGPSLGKPEDSAQDCLSRYPRLTGSLCVCAGVRVAYCV